MTISYESWKADKYVRIESDVKLISQMQETIRMDEADFSRELKRDASVCGRAGSKSLAAA